MSPYMRLALLVVAPWVLAGLIVVSCAHAQVTITTKGYIVLNCDSGALVSQHTVETEMVERALKHAVAKGGKASCAVSYPPKTIVVAIPVGTSGAASLSWTAPTQNVDGTPAQITGYRIVYGRSPDALSEAVQVGNVTSYTVTNLASGVWYFGIVALAGTAQSSPSNAVSRSL